MHEGLCYSCYFCVYKATVKSNIIMHKKSLHVGVRYSCNHCNHKTTQKSSLNVYIKLIHKGISAASVTSNELKRVAYKLIYIVFMKICTMTVMNVTIKQNRREP